ncbi:hypothetical protein OS493_027132 [Desmophyllum pertusum]|uniref:Uncharacterized protein n=1 Tax=Desmophyllum pertusum TaxID=174260 RepID=A0A9W9ZZ77_9CNID|nr:hypothetical protein OS493_027132 [Desmophyllum pertusum]
MRKVDELQNRSSWFAETEIVATSKAEEVVFLSGEISVVDHVETRDESPARYVGAFFHNRNSPFDLQKDKHGETFGSITLHGETYLVRWTSSHKGQHSIVQSQSIEYPAEAGLRKTHFLNITTSLKHRQTRLAYLFVAPGNNVTEPQLQDNEIGVHVSFEINSLSHLVSIATKYNSSQEGVRFLALMALQKSKLVTSA